MTSIPTLIAILLGISIPSLVLGRSVFAVLFGVGIILIFINKPFAEIRADLATVWRRPLGLLLLVIFALSLPSLFASDYPVRSFEAIARTFIFCNFGIVIWAYLKDRPALTGVWMKSLIISSAVAICFAFISQYVHPEPYWFLHLKGWKSAPLIHTLKGFAAITVLVIPLFALALSINKLNDIHRFIALAAIAGFLVLIVALGARASIAGMLAILLCVLVGIGTRVGSRFQLTMTAGLVLSCFAGTVLWLRITRSNMIELAPDGNYFLPVWLIDFERQTIWANALEIGLRTPWFGRGPNTINFAPGADKLLEGTQGLHVIPAHPHNWSVELFAEIGTVGLVFLLIFLLAASYQLLLGYRRSGNLKFLAAIAIFAGYWGSGLFNFSFWSAWWQLAFILAMGFSLSLSTASAKPPGKFMQ
ncbi:MAG: O-antigen ligase family protein [Rhodospirillales bacterium]|nr:O-antigen ligase family protein [Rhodospirillales bacterium]